MEEIFDSINWALVAPLLVIQGVLMLVAILDWARNQENIRGNRFVWLLVIIIVNTIGPILYFIFGRRS